MPDVYDQAQRSKVIRSVWSENTKLDIVLSTPMASGKTQATTLAYLKTRRAKPEDSLLCLAPTRALVEQK